MAEASQWAKDQLASVATIVKGNATDPAVIKAQADFATRLDADEATVNDQKTVLSALVAQLAANPPTTPVAAVTDPAAATPAPTDGAPAQP